MGGNQRYPDTWKLPPITLADLRPSGIPIIVICPACKRRGTINPSAIPAPDEADLRGVAHRLRCEGCGRRGGMSVSPEMEGWIRHLRETGQTHRLPWCAPFFSAT